MTQSLVLLYIVGTPLVGAFAVPILGRFWRRRNFAEFHFAPTNYRFILWLITS